MNENLGRGTGAKFLGSVLTVFGFLLMLTFVIPYLGIMLGMMGLLILFAGLCLIAYGSQLTKKAEQQHAHHHR